MKPVVHIITTLERGGAENQLITLVEAQVRSGRQVKVIPLKGRLELVDSFRNLGAEVFTNWMNKHPVKQVIGIRKSIRKIQPLVHAHLPRSEILSVFVSRRSNLILSRHNAEAFFPGAPKWLSLALSRYVTFGNTRVIAITEAVKSYLVNSGEVASSKFIFVVEYGFSGCKPNEKYETDRAVITDLGICDSELVIGTIGRLVEQKDYPTLVKGFAKFVRAGFDSKLIVLGEGDLHEELVALSESLGIKEKIVWLGKREDVFKYLAVMDVFVLASKYEGFGLVLLEAMSVGVPIVASRNLAVEQVLGSSYPWLFEIENADQMASMISAILEEENRVTSVLHGHERLTYFSVERMLEKMDLLYD
jgi:glycosyltransferase involved in cell wall biosynthesis